MAIRFHLDENVHGAVADALRRRGIDATTPSDAGLCGATDEQHLAYAGRERRVIITHDVDLLRLHARGAEHAGIAFCQARGRSLRQRVGALSLLAISAPPEGLANRVVYLWNDPGRRAGPAFKYHLRHVMQAHALTRLCVPVARGLCDRPTV
ncbi:MAG: DUF5615 family PIN-like protein [Planctomycetota bacterium]